MARTVIARQKIERGRFRRPSIKPFVLLVKSGAPGEIRTPGLLVRSQTLYPTELRAQFTKQILSGHIVSSADPMAKLVSASGGLYPAELRAQLCIHCNRFAWLQREHCSSFALESANLPDFSSRNGDDIFSAIMPFPSRNARDGKGATKPSCFLGCRFCRGRRFLGRAAVFSILGPTKLWLELAKFEQT